MSVEESRQPDRARRSVIIGVAASDSHAVANILIERYLRAHGFHVVNLGVCTPVSEFVEAYQANPTAEAVLIGSVNGHVFEDLAELSAAKASGALACPVMVGGNLSVGVESAELACERLYGLGVDRILSDPTELPMALNELQRRPRRGLGVAG